MTKPNGDLNLDRQLDVGIDLALDVGVPVFPLRERGKTPLEQGSFAHASRSDEQVQFWCEKHPRLNWGVPTGPVSGFIVLDLDVPHGPGALADLKELAGETLPKTWASQTPTGGYHLWFRYDGDDIHNQQPVRVDGRRLNGLDVRGAGGYVVGPGSLADHDDVRQRLIKKGMDPNGVEYADNLGWRWFDGHSPIDLPVADLPEAYAALLRSGSAGFTDSPTGTLQSGDSCCAGPEAAPESGQVQPPVGESAKPRHDRVRDLAWELRQREVSEGTALECCLDRADRLGLLNEGRRGEVIRAVQNAYRKPIEDELGAADLDPDAPYESTSFEYVLNPDTIRYEYVVEPLFPVGGWAMLSADPKAGKTFLSYHGAIAMATGRPVFGRFRVPQRQRVVVYQLEMPLHVDMIRWRQLALGAGVSPQQLVELNKDGWLQLVRDRSVDLSTPTGAKRFVQDVRSREAQFVFIDNISAAFSTEDEDYLSSNPAARAGFKRAFGILSDEGIAGQYLHHNRKNAERGSRGAHLGATNWAAAAAMIYSLHKTDSHTDDDDLTRLDVELEYVGGWVPGPDDKLSLQVLDYDADGERATAVQPFDPDNPLDDSCIKLLCRMVMQPGGTTRGEYVKALHAQFKLGDKTADRLVKRAKDADLVVRKEGSYSLLPGPKLTADSTGVGS